uniref:RNA_pol_Rbc25 domain-containing protein n=2 Tax=Caenorhabditis tropicalis TaxID=1561998 RepID=A0A1I7V004_9PELO
MFILSLLRDTVAIKPHQLSSDQQMVIKKRLNERLANKVVPDLGLCICVYDIKEIGDSYILPGEGDCRARVTFRMIVFRPFVDEVIEAKVIESSRQGLTLSIEFFEDIFVPAEKLPEPHVFEEDGQVWYWEYAQEDGEPPAKLYMDPGKIVRFRTTEIIFKDLKPELTIEQQKTEKSMEVKGTMASTGLGCVGWWTSDENEEEEAVEDEQDEETK